MRALAVIVLVIIALGVCLGLWVHDRSSDCEKVGGYLVHTDSGRVCADLREIEP